MADLNANINVGIETTQALNQLKALQKQISQFHQSVAKSSGQATVAQRDLQRNFLNSVNAIQGFSAELKTVRTTAESFTNSLEKNKFSMREYFRYAGGATQTFGKNFRAEFNTIEKTAIERVKTLQTQYIKLGRDASGAMQAIAIRPTTLNMQDFGTQTAIAAQKSVIFNQLVKQGSTNLLNFGKNTQWAGRQLMVGFTLPLATLGMTAGRVFFDMEKAAIKFKKVYGDLFTAPAETEKAMESIIELGEAYSAYGVAVSDSLSIAADAAAAGFQGVDLQNQTSAALKLSVLGQLDLQKALETTISLQNAFQLSSADLAGEIDFLNAVENQTVVSLDDITEAVPRVAPVIKQLGGDVRDLAFFLAAMKEGGVNASQGANALKSGLASLINPSEKSAAALASMGINIKSIVEGNQGDISGTVFEFATALDRLDPLKRAQAIEQLFGKFQFARISALFDNITRDGTQAQRVLDLAGSTTQELANLSESELGVSAASSMNKFRKAIEQIKVALAPIGQLFVEIATPFVEFGTRMLEAFNSLPDGIKKSIGTVITIIGGLGPIALMTFGLINNGIANMIKFFATVRLGYLKITGQAKGIGDETQYMTQEQLEAAAAAASLDQAHSNLIQRFTAEKVVVDRLRDAYTQAAAAGVRFAAINPGMMLPGRTPQKFAQGGFVSGPGNGTSDSIAALVSNGEAIIPAKQAKKYAALIEGIIAGNLPGFAEGTNKVSLYGGSTTMLSGGGVPFAQGNTAGSRLGMSKDFFRSEDFSKMFSAGAVGAAFRSNAEPGERVSFDKLNAYLQESEGGLKEIVDILRQSEASLSAANKDISSFDDITANAKKELQQVFDKMSQQSKKAQQVAAAVQREMLDPTKESITSSRLSETRARAVKANLDTGRMTETVFRTTGTRGQTAATSAAKLLFPEESNRLAATGSFAHLNEKRLGGSKIPFSGGILATQNAQMQQQAIQRLGIASAQQEAKFPEGQLINKAQIAANAKTYNDTFKSNLDDPYIASRDRNSPHILASQDGKSDGRAYGKSFNEEVSSVVTKKGPRRASDNPAVMAALGGGSQAQLGSGVVNRSREQRRATRVAGVSTVAAPLMSSVALGPEEDPENRSKRITAATEQQMQKMGKLTSSISTVAISMSAVTGLLSMFGGEMSAVTSIISLVTGGMFALMQAMSMLSASTGAAAVMQKVNAAGGLGGLFTQFKGVSKGLAGFGKGIGGIFGVLKGAFPIASRLVPVLGLVLAGFTAFTFIADIIEKQKQKIEGLGNAAAFSSDQIKSLGERLGVEVQTIDYTAGVSAVSGGQSTAEQERTTSFLLDPEFKIEYADAIAGIEFATKEQAERALASLATQLVNSGFDEQTTNAIIAAIVQSAGRTDLKLKFKSIKIDSAEAAAAVTQAAAEASEAFNVSYEGPEGIGVSDQQAKDAQVAAGVIKASFDSVGLAFRNGLIPLETYETEIANLFNTISESTTPKWLLDLIAEDMGIGEFVNQLDAAELKAFAVKAAVAGIKIEEDDKKILRAARGTAIGSNERKEATKVVNKYAFAISNAADNVDKLNKAEKETDRVEAITDVFSEQKEKIEQNDAAYKALRESGLNAADSIGAVGDAAFMEAWALASTDQERQDLIDQYKEMMKVLENSPFEQAKTRPAGGSNPIADAIKALKDERNEILNTSKAYSALRKQGIAAANALRFAQNPQLLSAMNAGLKVGSKQWDEIIKRIKAAEAAARKFQMATASGQKEYFDEVYGKVQDFFSASENLMQTTFEVATAADTSLILKLENKIKDLNSEIQDYEYSLEEIAEKENEITKEYDKKTKALENVKRVNEDILRQQKSQLSIADALSRGDVSAAASAMQQSREENAKAAMDSQGNLLDIAKQAQLDSLTAKNGLTREEIEKRIKDLKKEISDIERGDLAQAQSRIDAAQKKLDIEIAGISVLGRTAAQWDNLKAQTDKAQAGAVLYNKELKKSVGLVEEMIAAFQRVPRTAGSQSPTAGSNFTPTATNTRPGPERDGTFVGQVGPQGNFVWNGQQWNRLASGGMVKTSYLAGGGMIRPSYFKKGGSPRGTDTVPAMLTPGEFVVRRSAVESFGVENLKSINNGSYGDALSRGFNQPVYPEISRAYPSASVGGGVYSGSSASESNTQVDNSVYNYSLSVNVEGTNASPDQIANVVMRKLQDFGSQRVRRQVVR